MLGQSHSGVPLKGVQPSAILLQKGGQGKSGEHGVWRWQEGIIGTHPKVQIHTLLGVLDWSSKGTLLDKQRGKCCTEEWQP